MYQWKHFPPEQRMSRPGERVGGSGRGGEAVRAVGVGGEVAGVRPRDEVDVGEVCNRKSKLRGKALCIGIVSNCF